MRRRSRALRRAFTVLAVLSVLPSELMAQDLGRLFSTQAERRALDQLRLEAQFARPEPEPEPEPITSVDPKTPTGPAVSRLEINGIVRRSGGPATVWVNGAQVERGQVSREGLTVQAGARPDQGVRVSLPSGLSTVRLKPGQAVDVTTGTLVDAFERRPDPEARSGIESAPEIGDAPNGPMPLLPEAGAARVLGGAAAPAAPSETRPSAPAQPEPLSMDRLREIAALPPAERAEAMRALGGATASPSQ